MSFSGTVKEELAKQKLGARHCQIAEIAAIIRMCGGISVSRNDRFLLKIQTENLNFLSGSIMGKKAAELIICM